MVALGQGSRLLESINEPVVRDPDHNMNQDELENLATVQRLGPKHLDQCRMDSKHSPDVQ